MPTYKAVEITTGATYLGKPVKVHTTYAFDPNTQTYCCELTPSYWLEQVNVDVRADWMTERERDDAQGEAMADDGSHYRHCHCIARLRSAEIEAESLEDARDYWRGTWPF